MIYEKKAVLVYNGEDECFTVTKCCAGEPFTPMHYNIINEDAHGDINIKTVLEEELFTIFPYDDAIAVVELLKTQTT